MIRRRVVECDMCGFEALGPYKIIKAKYIQNFFDDPIINPADKYVICDECEHKLTNVIRRLRIREWSNAQMRRI